MLTWDERRNWLIGIAAAAVGGFLTGYNVGYVPWATEIGAQNAVGGSLLSWLPYLLFIIVPGLIIVTAVAYALSWAGKNEAKVGGGRRL